MIILACQYQPCSFNTCALLKAVFESSLDLNQCTFTGAWVMHEFILTTITTMSFRGVPVSEAEAKHSQQRDLAKMRVPRIFREPVDMDKVNRPIIKRWITQQLDSLLPDDDIVLDYTLELLESKNPNIKEIQLNLHGFLEDATPKFCKQLWEMLVAAQDDKDGIPPQLIALKKEQMEQDRVKREIKVESWTGGSGRGGRGGGRGRDRGGRDRDDRRSDARYEGNDRRDRRDRSREGRDRSRGGGGRERRGGNRSRSPAVKRETDEFGRDRRPGRD